MASAPWLNPTGCFPLSNWLSAFVPILDALMNRIWSFPKRSRDYALETTFYHLIRKFNRSPFPQPASRFLAASVAQRLRYCPVCLIEFGDYSLCWRFTMLTGCIYHLCHLLEKCGHCGQMVPLIVWPPKLGICPRCNGDLRTCPTSLLTAIERRYVFERHQELEFLLSSYPCDM